MLGYDKETSNHEIFLNLPPHVQHCAESVFQHLRLSNS